MELVALQKYGGYPAYCVVEDPYMAGQLAVIYPGDSVYYTGPRMMKQVEQAARRRLGTVNDAAALNALLGVTPAQAAAMKAGVEHGWDSYLANPAAYDHRGRYVG